MIEIVGVKFDGSGKVYYFDPNGLKLESGTSVLVETSRSVEMGKVVSGNHTVAEDAIVAPLKPVIRVAEESDFIQAEENKQKEKEAFDIAVEKIAEHKLDMKLVGAEYTFDRSKILFYFTADGRVDFRELVKSLAGIFRTRIELRQIGVRDEARQLGSIGICGRFLCCSTFLNDFHPVSIKMAKEQGLSLNPTKISGVCGRLMCCLQYEQNAYDDMLRRMPCRGDKVETPDGIGVVVDTATLKGRVKVKFTDDNGEMTKIEEYVLGEFNPLEKGKPVRLEKPEEVKADSDLTEYAALEETTAEDEPAPAQSQQEKKKPYKGGGHKPNGRKEHRSAEKPHSENAEEAKKDTEKGAVNANKHPKKGNRNRNRRNRNNNRNAAEKKQESKAESNPESNSKGGYSGGYEV